MTEDIENIIIEERPPIDELMDLICEHYDVEDILDCFDSDMLVQHADIDDCLDRVDGTYEWDRAVENAVDEKIGELGLRTDQEFENDLENAINKYEKNAGRSYKDMTPDILWEQVCKLLDIMPSANVKTIKDELEKVFEKMYKSSYVVH